MSTIYNILKRTKYLINKLNAVHLIKIASIDAIINENLIIYIDECAFEIGICKNKGWAKSG